MKEYIEREAVSNIIKTAGFWESEEDREVALICIEQAPVADIAPVRHGRWKNGGNGLYDTCSVCGKEIYLAIPMNYCPECGALMDGKEDEHEAD